MKTVNTILEATELVREYNNEIGIYGTQYFNLELEDETVTIRVSDHSANANNNHWYNEEKTISFVRKWNKQQCNMRAEYIIDEEGICTEYGNTIEWALKFELE